MEQMLTTTESSGLTLRLAIVCSGNHLRRGDDRIDDQLRHGAMTATSAQRDLHFVSGRHDRTGTHRHLSGRESRPVVHGIHSSAGKRSKSPSFTMTSPPPPPSSAGWKTM